MQSHTPYRFEGSRFPIPVDLVRSNQRRSSLGTVNPAQSAASIAAAGASTAGAIATMLATGAAAGPIGIAIAGAAAIAAQIYNLFSGCGQTCTMTSNDANQIEPLLLQNLNAYLALPQPHYKSVQQAYLNNFLTTWNSLVAACSNPQFGQAGANCIADRQQGACHYRTATPGQWTNGTWTPPGPQVSSGGSCWNWWVGYHDPIANDPTVVPDPAGLPGSVSPVAGSVSTDYTPLLLIAAVIVGVMLL